MKFKADNVYYFFDKEEVNRLSKLADELMNDGEEELAKEVFTLNYMIIQTASKVGRQSIKVKNKLNKNKKYKGIIELRWEEKASEYTSNWPGHNQK